MFYHARNGSVAMDGANMDYIRFGDGPENLIIIPGLSDGLQSLKGMAVPMALRYRAYAGAYTVYIFGRKSHFEEGYSTRDMARDLKAALDTLGVSRAHIVGVSQGGMIAQYLAVDYPALVEKLVLAVSLARPNETVKDTIGAWIRMAEAGDYKGIAIDSVEKSYTERYVKRYRPLYPFLALAGKKKDFRRFIIQAEACIRHNAYDELAAIQCPTLVIGAERDLVVGGDSSRELAEAIAGSRLIVYEGLSHGAYEEARDFDRQVIRFIQE